MDASEGELSVSMYRLAARPPCRTLISDASKHAVGGFCLETGQCWRCDLSEEELACIRGSIKHLQSQDSISIMPSSFSAWWCPHIGWLGYAVSVPWRTRTVCCFEVTMRDGHMGAVSSFTAKRAGLNCFSVIRGY